MKLVRLKRPITDSPVPSFFDETGGALTAALDAFGYKVPAGCLGLQVGRRTHFDLGYVQKHGHFPYGPLPSFDGLTFCEDLEDLGEWNGKRGDFTEVGWNFNPILNIRSA